MTFRDVSVKQEVHTARCLAMLGGDGCTLVRHHIEAKRGISTPHLSWALQTFLIAGGGVF